MAVSVNTSGTQTATLDTEHDLATVATPGIYQVYVDASEMQSGDATIIKIYGKCLAAGTERLIYMNTFTDVQSTPLLVSPVTISPHHLRVTLEQTDGVGRSYIWAVYATGA